MKDKQPNETRTNCYGYDPIRAANRLLKKEGLVLRMRDAGGDAVYLRLEKLVKEPPK